MSQQQKFEQTAELQPIRMKPYQESQYVRSAKEVTTSVGFLFVGLVLLIGFITAIIGAWHQYIATASWVLQAVIWILGIGIPVLLIYIGLKLVVRDVFKFWHAGEEITAMRHERDRLNEKNKAEVARIQAEARRIEAQAKQLLYSLPVDGQGNALFHNPYTNQVSIITGQMRELPEGVSSVHWHNQVTGPKVEDQKLLPDKKQKEILENLHIPTFGESFRAGLIGPGQAELLICYELERDEETGELTGRMTPYQDELQNNCTMFLGGASKSGKTTLMSHLAAQEAMMNALYYVIDPHLTHPEKSIAVRLQHLSHAFILPPAMTDADVFKVYEHAKAEAEARLNGRETALSGRPIVFIVDEALALISRSQRTDNKDIRKLYKDLVLFMRDLGTQYNKYDVNGIFATQYVTKEAFKLPAPDSNLDFRDACQNNTLLRLPPNQAQAMRLLARDELRGVRQLPQGHGYMGFYDGEVIRMASGNVTMEDLKTVGRIVAPVPDVKQYAFGTSTEPKQNPRVIDAPNTPTAILDGIDYDDEQGITNSRSTDGLDSTTQELNNITPLQRRVEAGTEPVRNPRKKDFTPEQENDFLLKYSIRPNIKFCLNQMKLGVEGYYDCAKSLLARHGLREA